MVSFNLFRRRAVATFKDLRGYYTYRKLHKKYCSHTMIPLTEYVKNLIVVERHAHVQGCVIECGTWRGG
jgi:hypothetical protein